MIHMIVRFRNNWITGWVCANSEGFYIQDSWSQVSMEDLVLVDVWQDKDAAGKNLGRLARLLNEDDEEQGEFFYAPVQSISPAELEVFLGEQERETCDAESRDTDRLCAPERERP